MECNLGSEIGLKMRSAVKAKLLELGTGGSAGFIDDELPDYVMVMVANKRTKQQMNAELNLFLGDQTDLFVTWLHEVLQKLQEVTLPASSAANKKRKTRQIEVPKAKEKKIGKKDKKGNRKSGDDVQSSVAEPSTTSADSAPIIGSITDVFAEELLEKAKKTLDMNINMKNEILQKKKKRKSGEEHPIPTLEAAPTKDFDIPTMSEISSTTSGNAIAKDISATSGNREKDLAELAEIQKKIYAAKQHLRKIGELEDGDHSEDDDFLNLNEKDDSVGNDSEDVYKPSQEAATRKTKSPIIFNRRTVTPEPTQTARDKQIEKQHERRIEPDKATEEHSDRRSVHDRLGCKPQVLERTQRAQKELYVPTHRRRGEQESDRQTDRSRERTQRERSRERDRDRDASKTRRSPRDDRSSRRSRSLDGVTKHRIGSRVIVAPNKPPEPSDDEDLLEKPVNSIIKIKPRPHVSPRRQACKNLLLRAVADAQRSTILAKPVAKKDSDEPELISLTMGKRKSSDAGSKSFRDRERERAKRSAPSNELFRRTTRELVVNVLQHDAKRSRRAVGSREQVETHVEAKLDEEEYVPELSGINKRYSGEYQPYVPKLVDNNEIDLHIGSNDETSQSSSGPKTQFVVTLNGDKSLGTFNKRSSALRKRTPSPTTAQVSSSSASNNTEPSSTTMCISRRTKCDLKIRERTSSKSPTSSNTPPSLVSRSLHRSEVLRLPTEIKKIIIKNDTDEDDEPALHEVKRKIVKRLEQSVGGAPISNNGYKKVEESVSKIKEVERSTTPPLPLKKQAQSTEKRATSNEKATVAAEPLQPTKSKHTPIKYTLKSEEEPLVVPIKKRRSSSQEPTTYVRDSSTELRKISIRTVEDKKYDNLPALSAVSVDSTVLKVSKPKERCKYHPNCTKQFCDYYHPSAPCKSFPNCKFADKCMYSHPKCKFDMACMSIDCNFAHSGARDLTHVQLSAPPLSSHVIPVQNYKSISAPITTTTATTMCKYYPNCTKVGCTFYHPKPCRYGKNCINKLECIFYHPEMQSKFKWVASLG